MKLPKFTVKTEDILESGKTPKKIDCKLPKFTVKTEDILESGKTPEQIGCEIITMAMVARDGKVPTAGEVEYYMPNEGIKHLMSDFSGEDILGQVSKYKHRKIKNRINQQNHRAVVCSK